MRLTQKTIERFWSKVDKSERCWEWAGGLFSDGYGQFGIKHRPYGAHRVSYIIAYGKIPKGLYVCHHCDNRKCVRSSHLFLGTAQQNTDDARQKGRLQVPAICHLLGEASPNSKLTERQVLKIRELSGTLSSRKLAAAFSVGQATLQHIVKRRTWKHL